MKLAELIKTPTAKAVRKHQSDRGYLEWLILALKTTAVKVYKQDEILPPCWAIQVVDTDYWLEMKKSKREALALCKAMGWKVEK